VLHVKNFDHILTVGKIHVERERERERRKRGREER